MILNRSLESLMRQWRSEVDGSLETGEIPVLYLGQGPSTLGELQGPLSLQWLDETREDAIMPLAAGGGVSAAWLMALLHQRGPDAPLLSPGTAVSFTGPDPATHTASLNVLDLRRSQFRRRPLELPPGYQPLFAPYLQGGDFAPELLPFAVTPALTPLVAAEGDGERVNRTASAPTVSSDGWVAWVCIVVALILLLIAFIA